MRRRRLVVTVLLLVAALLVAAPGDAADTGPGWAFAVGGPYDDGGHAVAVDQAGHVIVAGEFAGTADFDPNPDAVFDLSTTGLSDRDVFVAKYSPAGALVWPRAFGGPDWDMVAGITVDGTGNIYLAGDFIGDLTAGLGTEAITVPNAGSSGRDVFVVKMAPNGTFLWAKGLGGPGNDAAGGIAVDGLGYVHVTGAFEGTADFDPSHHVFPLVSAGKGDVFVATLDPDGDFVGAMRIGGSGSDGGSAMTVDAADHLYVAGFFEGTVDFDPGPGTMSLTSAGYDDVFAMEMEAPGLTVWAAAAGSPSPASEFPTGIAVDDSGAVYVAGIFFGTADFCPGPCTAEVTGNGTFDAFVWKLSGTGGYLWAHGFGGKAQEFTGSIAVDRSGVYLTGNFNHTVDFDPGPDTATRTAGGGYPDVFVLKLGLDGSFRWVAQAGGTEDDWAYGLTIDDRGSVFTTGTLRGTADFDPTRGTLEVTGPGFGGIYVWVLEDTSGPRVDLRAPAAGDVFPPMATPVVDFSCSDGGSGLKSCTATLDAGPITDGAPLVMSNGSHTVTVLGEDWAGNITAVSHTYSVDDTCGGMPVTIHGTIADDTLTGTPGPDVIRGYGGNDVIEGKGGDDRICGDLGDDLLLGGPGDDWIWGGGDNDKLRGASGDDHLYGEAGSDRLLPEDGNDFLDGGAGSDIADYLAASGPIHADLQEGSVHYTPGTDSWNHTLTRIEKIDGTPYADILIGDARRNVLRGKHGADEIIGGDGPDDLIGGLNDDQIRGNAGDDLIKGQGDDDHLWGGTGDDTIRGGHGNDWLWGDDGADRLWGGLIIHHGTFTNHLDGGPGIDTCRWDFDPQTNCNP